MRPRFFAFIPVAVLAAFLVCFTPGASVAAEPVKLTVYTAIEPELLGEYAKAFAKNNPDITIVWVRDSAGPIAARLLAEKDAPRADVVFGLALSALLPLEEHGVFEPYAAKGTEHLSAGMYDTRDNPVWVGTNAWRTGICVNTRELEKKKLPMPETWADLTAPVYKGHIVMPNPVSSSTGYMEISAWLLRGEEEQAWALMDALHKNVAMYTHSGSKPAQMAARGEFPIGISSPTYAKPFQDRKAPVAAVIPKEGTGWDLEAGALVKGGRNKEAAQKLLDFSSSPEVAGIGLKYGYIPARKDADSPELEQARANLLPLDPVRSSAMRERVLQEWRKRFEAQ